jgi:hypothetical protein
VTAPDVEDVLAGEHLAAAHRVEIHAEFLALGEHPVDELRREPLVLLVFARVAAGAPEVAAHRRTDDDELRGLPALLAEYLLARVDSREQRVDEEVADEPLANAGGEPRDHVLHEDGRRMAFLEESPELRRPRPVFLVLREFLAEPDHAHDVAGRRRRDVGHDLGNDPLGRVVAHPLSDTHRK